MFNQRSTGTYGTFVVLSRQDPEKINRVNAKKVKYFMAAIYKREVALILSLFLLIFAT
jgi:hypothetical protein